MKDGERRIDFLNQATPLIREPTSSNPTVMGITKAGHPSALIKPGEQTSEIGHRRKKPGDHRLTGHTLSLIPNIQNTQDVKLWRADIPSLEMALYIADQTAAKPHEFNGE